MRVLRAMQETRIPISNGNRCCSVASHGCKEISSRLIIRICVPRQLLMCATAILEQNIPRLEQHTAGSFRCHCIATK